MSTLAERFSAAVELAMELDTPAQIMRRIMADPVDTGLRAASLDGKISGGTSTSHPERHLGLALGEDEAKDAEWSPRSGPTPRRHLDAITELADASEAVVESVIGLLDTCLQESPDAEGYTWADAVKDLNLLDQLAGTKFGVDRALDRDFDRSTHRLVERLCEQVDAVDRLSKAWPRTTGRAPTSVEAAWTDDLADEDCCRICLSVEPVGVIRSRRRPGEQLCRTCGDLRRAADGIDPPPSLIAVWHDCDRKGQSIVWRAARSRWLESEGVRAS